MSINRIQQGDSIPSLSASTWGAFCDMAEQWMLSRGIQIVRSKFADRDSGIILIDNATGGDVTQGAVLEITGTPFVPNTNYTEPVSAEPYYTRRANLRAFMRGVVLTGDVPSSDNVKKFAITIAPARDGTVVQAITSGAVHVRVKMNSEDHAFARPVNGETAYLESAASGPVQLLYVQPDAERDPGDTDNLAWCVGLLGGGGSSEYFPVKVKKDGGAAGDAADPCSWTYSVYSIDAPTLTAPYLLDTALTPKMARTAIGPYQYAPDGSEGLCRYQNGDIVLCVAWGEVPEVAECTQT